MKSRQATPRQLEIFQFIKSQEYPPTFAEIADHFGIRVGAVQQHITALKIRGYLQSIPGKSRGLRVCGSSK